MIPKTQCIHRRIYRIISRNLSVGVWDENRSGFVGIRKKFSSRYLFLEFHWDNGPPYGTAYAVDDTGLSVPEIVSLQETLGTIDTETRQPCSFEKSVKDGGKGWYHTATGEPLSANQWPTNVPNVELFEILDLLCQAK